MSTAAVAGRTGPEEPNAATRAGTVVLSYIGAQVDELGRSIARMERYEDGSVARTRAAIHRIRETVRGYRHLFVDAPSGGDRLDRLLAALERAEDLEGLRHHFADRFAGIGLWPENRPRWYRLLDEELHDAHVRIDRISSQTWVAVLLEQVRLFADHARFTRAGDRPAGSLVGVLTAAKNHLLDTYARQSAAADLTAARDETRRAARTAKCLAEAVAPALGAPADDIAAPMAELERLLARYRLSAIAKHWLQRLPGTDRALPVTMRLADLEQEHQHHLAAEIDRAASAIVDLWH